VKLIGIRAPLRAVAQYPAPEWILAPRRATFHDMDTPKITAYLKTTCGWSAGVRAVLAKYNLQYTEKDIIQNPAFRWEMETKSGQPLSPCVEINDKMLADVSGEEVEEYLIDHKIVQPSVADAGVPINAPCPTEQHDSAVRMRF
jgi:monothiol glutaredoxin